MSEEEESEDEGVWSVREGAGSDGGGGMGAEPDTEL